MKLTNEQIDKIVVLLDGGDKGLSASLHKRLTRAFGERKNPYEAWRNSSVREIALSSTLFDAAAKVADGCDTDGFYTVDDTVAARAALKKIVEEIRGMA